MSEEQGTISYFECPHCHGQSTSQKSCTECGLPFSVEQNQASITADVEGGLSAAAGEIIGAVLPDAESDQTVVEAALTYVICPVCNVETQPGKFCRECAAELTIGDDTSQTLAAGASSPQFEEQAQPVEEPAFYDGHQLNWAKIEKSRCSVCHRPIHDKSVKYCVYDDCDATFLNPGEPILRVYAVIIKPLVIQKYDDVYLRVENLGNITAYGVTAKLDSHDFTKLPEEDVLHYILPGKYSLLPINLSYNRSGTVGCRVRLIYFDESDSQYSIVKGMKLQVLDAPDAKIASDHKRDPARQVVINIENFASGNIQKGNFTDIVDSVVNRASIGTDNVAIESGPGESKTKAPSTPESLRKTSGIAEVRLDWSMVEGAEKYFVERSEDACVSFQLLGNTTEPVFIDETALSGTEYHYRVAATGTGGTSPPTEPVQVVNGVHFEVETSLEFRSGIKKRDFEFIFAPKLRLGRNKPRSNNLENHLHLGSGTYISRKQMDIVLHKSYPELDQRNNRLIFLKDGSPIERRHRPVSREEYEVKTSKKGDSMALALVPVFHEGECNAVMIEKDSRTIIYLSSPVRLKWDPVHPDELEICGADDTAGNLPYQAAKPGVTGISGDVHVTVKKITAIRITQCEETDKWHEPVFSIEELFKGEDTTSIDQEAMMEATVVEGNSPGSFELRYDSSTEGIQITPV